MEFSEYYKNQEVVSEYDTKRTRGLKGNVTRLLELKFVEILLKDSKDKEILEVGFGTGFITALLVKIGKLTGVDISEEMLKKARNKFPEVDFKIGDILKLSLRKKFDRIVTIRVISHLKKEEAVIALKNLRDHLNPNGKIIFNIENVSITRRVLRRILNWGSTYNYQYSRKDLKNILNASNLNIDKILYLDHFFILPLHLLNKILFGKLDNNLFKLELKLKNVSLFSNNSFVLCKK